MDNPLHDSNPFIRARAWAEKYGTPPMDARDGKQGTDDIILNMVLKKSTYSGKYPAVLGESYYLTTDESGNWCAYKVNLPDKLGEKVVTASFKENMVTIHYGGQSWSAIAKHPTGIKATERQMRFLEMLAIESLVSGYFQKIKWTQTGQAFGAQRDEWTITGI